MRRRYRLSLVATMVAAMGVAVIGLAALGRGSEGPLSGAMDRVGSLVASIENAARRRFSGPGRDAVLRWFEPYRRNADRLRTPGVVLLGAYDGGVPRTLDGVVRLEQQLGTTLPLIQIYAAWGDRPEQQFPRQLLNAIHDLGSTAVVTWEPWLSDFDNARHPQLPLRADRDRHGMAAVARGDYDFYIDAWARQAARFGRPMLVRLGHEMNDPYRYPWGPQNNTKEEYIAFFRHVVDRFRAAGAANVLWVWSPHVAYEYWELYYPGDAHVDWVATGVLNYGPIAQWSRWWTFHEIFGHKYPRLASFGKPVMVAEFGSLAVGGDREHWYRTALGDLPRRYPGVRAVLFFNVADDRTLTYQRLDWTFTADSAVTAAVREQVLRLAPPAAGS